MVGVFELVNQQESDEHQERDLARLLRLNEVGEAVGRHDRKNVEDFERNLVINNVGVSYIVVRHYQTPLRTHV